MLYSYVSEAHPNFCECDECNTELDHAALDDRQYQGS